MSTDKVNIVDVRAKGADTSGHEPIDKYLNEHEDSDQTRYVFHPGTYRLSKPFKAYDWGESLEFIGKGKPTFLVEDKWDNPIFNFGYDSSGNKEPGNHLKFEGINFDIRKDGVGQPPIWALARYGMDIKNVRVFGKRSAGKFPLSSTIFGVTRETGRGEINRLDMPFGGQYQHREELMDEYIGLNIVRNHHSGLLRIKNSYVSEFPNNGYYVYRHSTGGNVHLENCIARNNGLNSFRIDDGDTCRGSKVLLDMDQMPFNGACALWAQGGGLFEDIYIKRKSGQNKLIRDSKGNITERFRNIKVDNEGNGDIINAHFDGGKFIIDGLIVNDTNDDPDGKKDGGNDYFTSRIKRDNVLLKNIEYTTSGDKRRGIHFENADKVEVKRSNFDVYGMALNFRNCGTTKVDDWCEFRRGNVSR